MPSAVADLSGGGPQQVYIWLSWVSNNQDGNYSTWYWELVYKNNGGLQWSSDPTHWWELSGFAATGKQYFGIPSGWAGSGDHMMGSGYFTKAHDTNGYLIINDNLYGTINASSHTGIGSGTATINSGISAPRIPKAPAAPTPYPDLASSVDQITSSSMRYRFQDGNNNGGAITSRAIQYSTSPDFSTGASSWIGVDSSGTYVLTGAPPGTTYYWRSRIQNVAGVSPNSIVSSGTTLAGVKVGDDDSFEPAAVYVSDGSTWIPDVPRVSTGSAWVTPS